LKNVRHAVAQAERQFAAEVTAAGERRLRAVLTALGEHDAPVAELERIPAVIAAAN
jgi:hypothetical protein